MTYWLRLGASRRLSADHVIVAALGAMERDERRRVAAAEALAIKDDPAELAEIHAIIAEQPTLVMCDQLATVDLTRLNEAAGFLTVEEMERVDQALTLVLDL
ncbi:MAG: type II toxin-antitoxin system PemK/MazF family toxin [Jatrophihabitans sp.]